MKEKNKKKSDNGTFKIVFKIVLVIMAVFVLLAGLFLYKILYTTENEISAYNAYLEGNIDLKQREAEKYEDIIPHEIKEMQKEIKEIQFDNYARHKYNKFFTPLSRHTKKRRLEKHIPNYEIFRNLESARKYYELSRNLKAAGGDRNLIDAYTAYGNYYDALYSKAGFALFMKSVGSNILSKIFFAKVAIGDDSAYKKFRENNQKIQTETPKK
ncbi:MAG: hypothetical protein LBL00_01415 [Endomicrobium sp.]|nr:hypothetical protein [Endomicrobium sp.]